MIIRNTHGNALFLILIAVALFAALSYAVTQSGRGGSGIDREQASLISAEIIQYAGNVNQAVQRLRLINGCSETEISFHYDSDGDGTLETDGSDDFYNPNAPTDLSCHVMHSNGGGLTHRFPDADWLVPFSELTNTTGFLYDRPIYTAEIGIVDIGTNCVSSTDTQCRDLLWMVPNIKEELCIELNSRLGIDISSFAGEGATNFGPNINDLFIGSYPRDLQDANYGDQQTEVSGQTSGCVFRAFFNSYHFYHVLIAR